MTPSSSPDALERRWAAWLAALRPWDLHTVLRFELDWHDEFVAGRTTLAELAGRIRDAQGLSPAPAQLTPQVS